MLICLSWGFLYPVLHHVILGVVVLPQDAQLDGGRMEDSEGIWAHLHHCKAYVGGCWEGEAHL